MQTPKPGQPQNALIKMINYTIIKSFTFCILIPLVSIEFILNLTA